MEIIREVAKVGDVEIAFETGKLAKQASAVVMSCGGTALLVTAVSNKNPKDLPFLPLTVEYREANAAAGKIPGGYFKREGRPSEKEILTCRLIDRPIRPLFPKSYRCETQIIASLHSYDKSNEPDVLGISGASAALALSDAPWVGPIAGIRVARVNGDFVAFPTYQQIAEADLNLIVACSADAIVMVEAGASELTEAEMIDALMFAKDASVPLIEAQLRLRERAGKAKREHVEPEVDEALEQAVFDAATASVTEALTIKGKHDRHAALSAAGKSSTAALREAHPDRIDEISAAISKLEKRLVRTKVVDTKVRIDGRALDEIRPIFVQARPYERPHGSAVFQRGETQAFVTTTLGTERRRSAPRHGARRRAPLVPAALQLPAVLYGRGQALRGQSRREIGHGAWQSAPCRAFCRRKTSSPTRSAWSPTRLSPTVRPPWRPCAAAA